MKRRSICSLLVAVLLLCTCGLAACQTDGAPSLTQPTGTNAEPTATDTPTQPITDPIEPEELPMKLKFGSYNIKHGADAELDMTKLARNVTHLGLDVVGLQEVDQMTTISSQQLLTLEQRKRQLLSVSSGIRFQNRSKW